MVKSPIPVKGMMKVTPSVANRPITMAEMTSMAPTDRSIPAVKMIMVWAMATMPVTVTCLRISDSVLAVMKLFAKTPKARMLTTAFLGRHE